MNQEDNPPSATPVQESSRVLSANPSSGPIRGAKPRTWLRGPTIWVVLFLAGVPAATTAWFLVPIGYTATVELHFLATSPEALSKDGYWFSDTPYKRFLNTQVSLVTSNAVLLQVLDSTKVRGIPALSAVRNPLSYLKRRVHVRIKRSGEIVTVSCVMPDRDAAQNVLQEIVTVYMEYALREEASAGTDRLVNLEKERNSRQKELESQLKAISDLQSSMGVPMIGQTPLETGEAQLYNESLARAEEELAKAQNAQAEHQAQLARIDALIKSVAKGAPIYELGVEDRVSADARVGALRQEVVKMQANLVEMEDFQQDNSPQLKVEQKRLASLKDSLAEVELGARKEVLQSMRIQQAQEIDVNAKAVEEAQQRANKFRQLADEYKERVKSATDQYVQIESLKNNAAETRRLLDDVQANIVRINTEGRAPARVWVATPVTVSAGGPDYTPRLAMMALALVASLGLGIGIALLREIVNQKVRHSQDLARLTHIPVIAAIPRANKTSLPGTTPIPRIMEQAPTSALANEYRRILAWFLLPNTAPNAAKSVVVVSPTHGDGKSSVIINLGTALAQSGRRVLLVDLCYQGPSLATCLGLAEGPGLAEVLNDPSTFDRTVQTTNVPALFVLSSGLDPGKLASRLGSQDMARFLEYAAEQFDLILIDTHPWLAAADAALVAPLANGVLVTVGAGVSTREMVRRCLHDLDQIKAHVLGIVLNGL